MSSKQIAFSHVPNSHLNLSVLGALVFDRREMFGPKAFLDLRAIIEHKLLARDFIATLYEHASPGRMTSDNSVSSYIKSIKVILEYCRISKIDNEFRMRDIGLEFLLDYRAHLRVTREKFKSGNRWRIYSDLLRLLQAGQTIGLTHPELQPTRSVRIIADSDITQPYTLGEALDIEDACRHHIRELTERLKKGKQLLLEGVDPRVKPMKDPATGRFLKLAFEQRAWNQLPNLLWYIINIMDGRFYKNAGKAGMGLSSFNNATSSAWHGAFTKKDVFSYLYPLTEDLIPFINLLAKTTGRNESSILGLDRECLQELDGRYILWYRKERGGERLYKKQIPNDGVFSPVALIKKLREITEPLVRHAAPSDQGKLFLGLTIRSRDSNFVKSLDPVYIKYQMNRDGGWCDQHNLIDEHGQPLRISMRRWRVYYLTRRYQSHGQLGKVSRDAAHTLSKTTVGYINNDATKNIHERAIDNGIKAAYSLARPTVLPDDSKVDAAQSLNLNHLAAQKVLRGEQDVFFAACKDFYNRPEGPPNTPCDKPWNCLLCSNAVITRHVLPRVLAFRDFMVQQQAELSCEDWNFKFANAWQVLINDILPKFSSSVIAEAESSLRDENLYIPIFLKV